MSYYYTFYKAFRPLSDIFVIGCIILLILFFILFIFPEKDTQYKRKFKYLCKELNINKHYAQRLKSEKSHELYSNMQYIECDRDFKQRIMEYYTILVLNDIRLYKYDYGSKDYFSSYYDSHKEDIFKLRVLLEDYYYEHNAFLFQNIIYLSKTLKEPIMQIDNIKKLDIPNNQRFQEINTIENKIFESYDIFLNMVNRLYEQYKAESNIKKPIAPNSGMFDNLEKYQVLLMNMQADIDNKKGVFLNKV